jgi:hypothetical protein
MLAADGVERCLPATPVNRDLLFTDATCQIPVIPFLDGGCTPTTKYALAGGALCPKGGVKVYAPGSPIAAPRETYVSIFGACIKQNSSASSNQKFLEAIPSPLEGWAAFDRELVPVTDRLGVAFWVGADGSRVEDGLRLLPDDLPCEPSADVPGRLSDAQPMWCIPSGRASEGQSPFLDEACDRHLTSALSCEPAQIIQRTGVPSACGVPLEFFEIAGVLPDGAPHLLQGATCAPAGPVLAGGQAYYRVGPPLRPESYPSLELTPQGTGRFRQLFLTSGGRNIAARGIYDGTYDSACAGTVFPDGSARCAPGGAVASWNGDYSDPTCTRPIAAATCQPLHTTPTVTIVGGATTTACAPAAATPRAVGRPYSGPLYAKQGAGCDQGVPNPDQQYYETGDPLDPGSLFALLQESSL